MVSKLILFFLVALPTAAFAQEAPDFSPPPMVPVAPPPPPAPEPGSTLVNPQEVQPGTPPPPSTVPPSGYVPGQRPSSGYPYSPYGQPLSPMDDTPPVEWGLWLSESLFGMLTSAGVSLIPYFLLLRPMVIKPQPGDPTQMIGDKTVSAVIFFLIFAAVPLAVSQTQLSLANGSRYYYSESWPAALAGLGAEALVLGIFCATIQNFGKTTRDDIPITQGGSEAWLLLGSIALVPLIQVAVINLTKSLRAGKSTSMLQPAAMTRSEKGTFSLGMPTLAPLVGQTRVGLAVGIQTQLINVRF